MTMLLMGAGKARDTSAPTAPTLLSATTDETGLQFILTFSAAVTLDQSGSIVVNADGSPVSGFDDVLGSGTSTITLVYTGMPVNHSQTITVSFGDAAFPPVLAVTDFPVTNIVPPPPTITSASTDTSGLVVTFNFSESVTWVDYGAGLGGQIRSPGLSNWNKLGDKTGHTGDGTGTHVFTFSGTPIASGDSTFFDTTGNDFKNALDQFVAAISGVVITNNVP